MAQNQINSKQGDKVKRLNKVDWENEMKGIGLRWEKANDIKASEISWKEWNAVR